MKRMLLTIAYDGTAFHGWQVQPNGITVQETLQNALEKLLGTRPAVTGCSRTDAGVHANAYICHLDCEAHIPCDRLPYATLTAKKNFPKTPFCGDLIPFCHPTLR